VKIFLYYVYNTSTNPVIEFSRWRYYIMNAAYACNTSTKRDSTLALFDRISKGGDDVDSVVICKLHIEIALDVEEE
jgi:hypothetical protein